MITGELKSKVDRVWDAFWSGGISNPLEVIEQITYLLFIRRLDDLETLEERKARLGAAGELRFGSDQQELRWSRFKNEEPAVMFATVGEKVFPFLRTLGGDGSTYGEHMKGARFTIPTPQLLSRVVDLLDEIPMNDRDTNGDLYEYMLGKIAAAGQNGQFRTPRHIIQLMVDMMAPESADEIRDPACGTAGFLVAAAEYIREAHPSVLTDAAQRKHFHASMFHGYDFDNTMLRIASMNMLMHGIESPDIRRDRARRRSIRGAEGTSGTAQDTHRRSQTRRRHSDTTSVLPTPLINTDRHPRVHQDRRGRHGASGVLRDKGRWPVARQKAHARPGEQHPRRAGTLGDAQRSGMC